MISRSLAVNRSVAISPTDGGVRPGALNMSKEMTASPTFMRVRMTEPRKLLETTSPVSAVALGAFGDRACFRAQRQRNLVAGLGCRSRAVRAGDPLVTDLDRFVAGSTTVASMVLSVPTKVATKLGGGLVVDFERRADLVGAAGVHDDDAVGDRQRFFLVVGDEDGGDAELRWMARISSRSETRILASSADSGSSSSSTWGRGAMARASATRCCWPPDIW
jgi:hypothetical protein